MVELGIPSQTDTGDEFSEDADGVVEVLPPQEMLSSFDGINIAGRSRCSPEARYLAESRFNSSDGSIL